jgi:hypothetical protein
MGILFQRILVDSPRFADFSRFDFPLMNEPQDSFRVQLQDASQLIY